MVETFGLYPKDNGRLLKSGGETTLAFLKDLSGGSEDNRLGETREQVWSVIEYTHLEQFKIFVTEVNLICSLS